MRLRSQRRALSSRRFGCGDCDGRRIGVERWAEDGLGVGEGEGEVGEECEGEGD